jgi:ribosomal protein S1
MKIQHLVFCAIIVLCSTMLNGAATAKPLEQYEQEVDTLMQQTIKKVNADGYQLSFPRNVASLNRGAEALKTVLLYPNREYIFVVVCDRNCKQIQLSVKDMGGKNIMSTSDDESVAVANFKPPSENRYQVTVKMEKCTTQSCYFGLGIFAKR